LERLIVAGWLAKRALRVVTRSITSSIAVTTGSFIFKTKVAFERTLFEACERAGWELLAYCILSNHFHLCLGTPRGNLSEGMRWLQATFANRFNRYRKESGHLFQGRFKSLVVELGQPTPFLPLQVLENSLGAPEASAPECRLILRGHR
jgi:hypothetical protein